MGREGSLNLCWGSWRESVVGKGEKHIKPNIITVDNGNDNDYHYR